MTRADSLEHGIADLSVVETNPFKHLTHLALKLQPGNDSDVKKYLAKCLKKLQVSVQFKCSKIASSNFFLTSISSTETIISNLYSISGNVRTRKKNAKFGGIDAADEIIDKSL